MRGGHGGGRLGILREGTLEGGHRECVCVCMGGCMMCVCMYGGLYDVCVYVWGVV